MTDNLPEVERLFCEIQKPGVLKLASLPVTLDVLCFKSFMTQNKASGNVLRTQLSIGVRWSSQELHSVGQRESKRQSPNGMVRKLPWY